MPRLFTLLPVLALPLILGAAEPTVASFTRDIGPVLDQYCYDCHGFGHKKGGITLDDFANDAAVRDHTLWLRVMKNVRAGLMPPADEPRPTPDAAAKLMSWIKREGLGLDPTRPDPGRITIRRLNRVEYRNTIRELTGVDYDTQKEFPPDDTGQGFDNLGDVLTISPMLLERYLDSAQTIIAKAVPTKPRIVAEFPLPGRQFIAIHAETLASSPPPPAVTGAVTSTLTAATSATAPATGTVTAAAPPASSVDNPPTAPVFKRPPPKIVGEALDLSYYTPVTVASTFQAAHAGKYQVGVSVRAVETYADDQFDLNRCRLIFKADGEALITQEFVREGDKTFEFSFDRTWAPGNHEFTFEIQPIGPDRDQKRQLRLRVNAVTVHGPLAPEYWVQPKNYTRYFPQPVPKRESARPAYAAKLLRDFATRAFRRPVDDETVDRLTAMAGSASAQPGNTFESGVAQAMVAVLASPRFVFREEEVEALRPGQAHPFVDEYALASRLSYFFWSSMPDAGLFRLAGAGQLRAQLPAQIARMLADPRAGEFVHNFTGQWLEARDIGNVQIDPFAVYLREHPDPAVGQAQDTFRRVNLIAEDKRTPEDKAALGAARKVFFSAFRVPKPQLSDGLRDAMRQETELVFSHIVKEDRSLVELIESDYTFLNEDLAKHYGIAGVTGKEMRKVMLPPDSPRGGVLTQGTVLAVTSNPTRTSPVKRGVFILDAILGTRPPPPPPNIPALEDAASPEKLRTMTLRENLALHATNKTCASCHSRMDPLGLALENFNAMGMWRDAELNRPIEPAGKLITGETFANVRELKHILATAHRRDFYYCFSQKLLTYALGRALEYYDIETLDQLVAQLESSGGRPSVLLQGIVNSAPFQQRRQAAPPSVATGSAGNPVTGQSIQ
jgi:hypothetical protein